MFQVGLCPASSHPSGVKNCNERSLKWTGLVCPSCKKLHLLQVAKGGQWPVWVSRTADIPETSDVRGSWDGLAMGETESEAKEHCDKLPKEEYEEWLTGKPRKTTKSSAEPGFHIDVIRKAPFANANICKPHQRSSKCRFHSFSLITCHCADLSNTNCACQQALQHWPSGAVIRWNQQRMRNMTWWAPAKPVRAS